MSSSGDHTPDEYDPRLIYEVPGREGEFTRENAYDGFDPDWLYHVHKDKLQIWFDLTREEKQKVIDEIDYIGDGFELMFFGRLWSSELIKLLLQSQSRREIIDRLYPDD